MQQVVHKKILRSYELLSAIVSSRKWEVKILKGKRITQISDQVVATGLSPLPNHPHMIREPAKVNKTTFSILKAINMKSLTKY